MGYDNCFNLRRQKVEGSRTNFLPPVDYTTLVLKLHTIPSTMKILLNYINWDENSDHSGNPRGKKVVSTIIDMTP